MIRCFVLAYLFALANAGNFTCPKEHGQFIDEVQCDKFYECKNGTAMEHLCPEGLVFNPKSVRFGKCDQPFNVDCSGREKLQETNRTSEFCKRKNGVFAHPDPTVCDVFFICDEGSHAETKCAPGLHFDEETGTCTWPNVINRDKCQDQNRKLDDGFMCPVDGIGKRDKAGQIIAHPHYPHPTDCQKFYACLNGIEPTAVICEVGKVYNEDTMLCDEPANVEGCETWYDVDEPAE